MTMLPSSHLLLILWCSCRSHINSKTNVRVRSTSPLRGTYLQFSRPIKTYSLFFLVQRFKFTNCPVVCSYSFGFCANHLHVPYRFSRISLVLSVTRIFLPGSPVRRNFFFMGLLFFVMYIVNMIQNTLLCRQGHVPEPFWRMPATHCLKTKEGRFPHGIITVACELSGLYF